MAGPSTTALYEICCGEHTVKCQRYSRPSRSAAFIVNTHTHTQTHGTRVGHCYRYIYAVSNTRSSLVLRITTTQSMFTFRQRHAQQ